MSENNGVLALVRSFVCSFVLSFDRSLVCSFFRWSVRMLVLYFVRSFVHSFVHPFIHPSIHPSIHSTTLPIIFHVAHGAQCRYATIEMTFAQPVVSSNLDVGAKNSTFEYLS